MSKKLKQRITTKQAQIAVIGLGYIGLPLAVSFAKAGYWVFGIDTDLDRVQQVNAKKSYILDVSGDELAVVVNKGRLSAHQDFSLIKEMDAIIICVPTPLKRKYSPDISYILNSIRQTRKYLKKDTLIVLESTTYPGTTEELIKPELEKSGKKFGRDFFLAFSPERIDPGNKNYHVTAIPKLIGGVDAQSGELARLLYTKVIKNIHVVSSSKTAEMAKLLENTFRIINIGWINEAAQMCHKMGINIFEVIEAAKTKPFGFMPFYPGLGVGGHCIPDDPLYLYWKARHLGFSSKYIKLSADINSSMPQYAVDCLGQILKKKGKGFVRSRVLVLGVTYKRDVHDLRKSPVISFIDILQKKNCRVDYHDPLIPYLKFADIDLVSVKLTEHSLKKYDCVVVAVDHSKVDYELVLKHARLIYDIKNVYKGKKTTKVVPF